MSSKFAFPDDLHLTIAMLGTNLTLNLHKNMYVSDEIVVTGAAGSHTLGGRIAVFNDKTTHASIIVECRLVTDNCVVSGSFMYESDMLSIQPMAKSKDSMLHVIKKKSRDEMKEVLDVAKRAIRSIRSPPVVPDDVNLDSNVSVINDEVNARKKREAARSKEDRAYGDIAVINDELKEAAHSRQRRAYADILGCEVVEVDTVVDHTVWDFFVALHGAADALEELILYIIRMYLEADTRLSCWNEVKSQVLDDDYRCDVDCIRVFLKSIHIQMNSGDSWSNYGIFYAQGYEYLDDVAGLYSCRNHRLNQGHCGDVTHCITRRDIVHTENGVPANHYRMSAYRYMCSASYNGYSVGIHEAKGDTEDLEIAHNILHGMNAKNDAKCDLDASFIMAEYISVPPNHPNLKKNTWSFSKCTIEAVCTNINALNDANDNCLDPADVPQADWEEYEGTERAGLVYDVDQQCKFRWGPDSLECDDEEYPPDMCTDGISCSIIQNNLQQCVCFVRVFSETPCGVDKVCRKGCCVFIGDLHDRCDCDDDCNDDNAECNMGTCQCKDDFFEEDGVCKPKYPIDEGPCDDDDQCLNDNAFCNEDSLCECNPGYIYNEETGECDRLSCLGEPCGTVENCKGDMPETECEAGTCQCSEGHYADILGECQPYIPLGGGCTFDDECEAKYAICDNLQCNCPPGYFSPDDVTCMQRSDLCEDCVTANDCNGNENGNVVCTANKCACTNGYYVDNCGLCQLKKPLDDECECDEECAVSNAICLDGICACEDTHYKDGLICVPKIPNGLPCPFPQTCLDPNAICDVICTCKPGYELVDGVCEENDGGPGDSCEDCCTPPLVCLDNVCGCPPGETEVGGLCYDDDFCDDCVDDPDTCADPLVCIDGKCACPDGKIYVNGECVDGVIGDPCDGTCTPPFICNEGTDMCECPPGQVEQDGNCYGSEICDDCGDNPDTCNAPLQCIDGTCGCPAGTTYNPGTNECEPNGIECPPGQSLVDGECVDGEIGDPCNDNPDTCSAPNTICEDGMCVCEPGTEYDAEDDICRVGLGDDCICFGEGEDNCKDDNAECREDSPSCDKICVCEPDFYNPDGCDNCGGMCVERIPMGGDCTTTGDCDEPCEEGYFCVDLMCKGDAELGDPCQNSPDCAEWPKTKCEGMMGNPKVCQCNEGQDWVEIQGVCLCDPFMTKPNPGCD